MEDDLTQPPTDRRGFLQAGALATVSALSLGPGVDAQDAPARKIVLPRRSLGKTDLEAGPNKLDFARLLPEVARKLA